ncbi:uncharacterized protein LOC108864223 [Galendromus occidentalis]|uniref:Uncharacterized protein LOC108864223 n=1 Tax=Galendromus occidentalis TaxID=34638 RepID=A0AAJ7L3Z5_9ACAR|nr:uncharacterized protein LOC108864223 [Galendromus occidentalis]
MVEELLQKLGVSEVDLLIAHSAGTHAAILMALNQRRVRIRSMALLCSTTSKLLPVHQPAWLHSRMIWMLHKPGLRKLIVPFYELVILYLGLKKITATEAVTSFAAIYATTYWYPDKASQWIQNLRDRGFPRMAIYSSRDSVVPSGMSEDFARELGNPDKANHFTYSGRSEAEVKLMHEPSNKNLVPIVHFKDGGHNVMTQFPETVADHLLEFVESQAQREC